MTAIPRVINDNEIIVRCTFHPFHFSRSKKKIKPEAFTPPPQRNDVSTLRLAYTNPDFCKRQGKSIVFPGNEYLGLTIFVASMITSIIENFLDAQPFPIAILATPLDSEHKIIEVGEIFITDDGLPMHADIVYGFEPEVGVPLPNYVKKFAKELSKNSVTYIDPAPEEDIWKGEELVYP